MKAGEKPLRMSAPSSDTRHRMLYRLRRRHYAEMKSLAAEGVLSAEAGLPRVLAEREQQIAKLTTDLTAWRDISMRAKAELENARKRFQREKAETIQFAAENLIRELIPVVDNLERALASAPAVVDPKALHDGIEMLVSQFLGILKANGLEAIAPDGQKFDPHFHEAVSAEEREDIEDNLVLSTMQKGYILRGRVVRPAMVCVGRAVRRPAAVEEVQPVGTSGEETLADFEDLQRAREDAAGEEPSDSSNPPA